MASASDELTTNCSTSSPSVFKMVANKTRIASLPPSVTLTYTEVGKIDSPVSSTVTETAPIPSPTRTLSRVI